MMIICEKSRFLTRVDLFGFFSSGEIALEMMNMMDWIVK